jgi:predicted TIM-barrel fold metal-dependent hydrolase
MRTLRGEQLAVQIRAGDVSVEIAMLEGAGGLARLLDEIPLERVLFGSHAPCFYFEAALLKLQESALTPAQIAALSHENARRWLAASP